MSKRKYDVFVRITDPSIKPRVIMAPRVSTYDAPTRRADDIRNLRPDEAAQLGALLRHAAALAMHDADVELFRNEPNEWDAAEPSEDEDRPHTFDEIMRDAMERSAALKRREASRRNETAVDPEGNRTVREPFESGIGVVTIGDNVAVRFQHIPGFGPARMEFTPEQADGLLRSLTQAIDNARSYREGTGNAAEGDGKSDPTAEPHNGAPAAGDAPTATPDQPTTAQLATARSTTVGADDVPTATDRYRNTSRPAKEGYKPRKASGPVDPLA